MTVSLKHQFVSNVTDSGDTTLVQPSNWNAEHLLTANANSLLGAVTTGNVVEITCTSAGRALLDDADASAQRTTLGLGTVATQNSNNISITGGSITGITDLAVADGGTGASDAATARTNLGIGTLGTQNANAVAITGGTIVANASGISIRDADASNVMTIAVGSNLTANTTLTLTTGATTNRTLDISATNVTVSVAGAALIDDADASAQRTTLGLGTVATQNSNNISITGGSISGITDLAVADGGTGASDASTARTNLGIGTIGTQNANNVSITGGSITGITDLAVADGGTGASDASTARTNLGIGTMGTQNANAVAITGGTIVANASGISIRDADASNVMTIAVGSNLTANTTLTLTTGAATNRTLDISASNVTISTAGAALIDDADAAAQRTTLGLGTISTQNSNNVSITGGSITGITDLAVADGGTGASDAATARTNLGLGTISTQNSNNVSITGGSITGITDLAVADGGTGASDAATARTNLGIGTIATQNANNVSITGGSITGITDLAVADGGTGASDAATARTNLGIGTLGTQNANAVAITGGTIVANASGISIRDADASNVMTIAVGSNLTANTTLTLTTGAATNRTLDISAANVTISTAGAALIDDADAAAQRTTLGLGTISTQNSNSVSITGGSVTGITDLALADGGTGASLADPNANAVLGWNDTAGTMLFFTAGTGISIDATTNTISSTVTAGGDYIMQSYVSPATWTKPAGLKAIKVTVVGGGGGTISSPTFVGAGGGGGVAVEYIDAPAIPGPVAVTVGSGGANTAPTTGGTSSFGAFCSSTGGSGATASPTNSAGGAGGAGSGGTVNWTSQSGEATFYTESPGTTNLRYGDVGMGGSTLFGFGGRTSDGGLYFAPGGIPAKPAVAGGSYGGGASGTMNGTGAAGGGGIVIVEEFY